MTLSGAEVRFVHMILTDVGLDSYRVFRFGPVAREQGGMEISGGEVVAAGEWIWVGEHFVSAETTHGGLSARRAALRRMSGHAGCPDKPDTPDVQIMRNIERPHPADCSTTCGLKPRLDSAIPEVVLADQTSGTPPLGLSRC